MQAGNSSRQDRVSLDEYELYLTRIGSWLQDLEVGVHGSRFHLERVQLQVIEEAEFEDDEFFAMAEDRSDASLSFDLDDLVCENVPTPVRGRKALDLGSRGSLELPSLKELSNAIILQEGERSCGKKRVIEKIKQMGLVGAAAAGVIALVFRH
ncbi:hypothetical protein BSKO_13260 [Bryopsis sp. KO-2023]|nr:hypothetical protein BSKO_13260 [Bryopsis sp. KO-2023]